MGFNLGAFIGGMSRQIVSDIEADEAYDQEIGLFKEKQGILSGAEIDKERKLKDLELQSNIQALKFAGFDDQRASQIAMSGNYAIERSLSLAEKVSETGGDINTYYKLADNSPENMNDLENEVTNIASVAGKISTGVVGFDSEMISDLYEKPKEIDGSYGAAISRVSQEQASLDPTSSEWSALEEKRQQYLKDLTDFKQAELRKDGTITPTFDVNTIEPVINSVQRRKMSKLKIEVDFKTGLEKRLGGDEGRYGVALLQTVNELEGTYGNLNDPLMTDKIAYKKQEAYEELRQYALYQSNSYAKNPDAQSSIKIASSATEFSENIEKGEYRAGDVVQYTDANGNLQIFVYTGIEGNDIVVGIN
jgi:hypothetical protein